MWLLARELFTPLAFSVIFHVQPGPSPARERPKREVTEHPGTHIRREGLR